MSEEAFETQLKISRRLQDFKYSASPELYVLASLLMDIRKDIRDLNDTITHIDYCNRARGDR